MNASIPGAVGDLYDVGKNLNAHLPDCPSEQAWTRRRDEYRLASPTNHCKLTAIVVGTGPADTGAVAILGHPGYRVECFSLHNAPRRAHSMATQGGINAAGVRKIDGDSLMRFVKDTVKGGGYRGRETNVVRPGLESGRVIDRMEAIGALSAHEHGGRLATQSFGEMQVSRTYYVRGQTGQQLEITHTQALQGQVATGSIHMRTHTKMFDLIVADSRIQGIITRDLLSSEIQAHTVYAVVLAAGGCSSVYHYSTLAIASNAIATWRAHRRGTVFASTYMVQFHLMAPPMGSRRQFKTTLMSELLCNNGRIWVPVRPGDEQPPNGAPEDERDYYLEHKHPASGNFTPRDVASRDVREQIESDRGVGPLRNSIYLDFRDALEQLDREAIVLRYSNPFETYLDATGEDPYEVLMHIALGAHFTMGGLRTDFDQMSTISGLFVGGGASNNYHDASCLGANSLLSADVDGWFVLPLVTSNYLVRLVGGKSLSSDASEALQALVDIHERTEALTAVGGAHHPMQFHHRLGEVFYADCGVDRSEVGLLHTPEEVRALCEEFQTDVIVVGDQARLNRELEKALWVADFLELTEVMVLGTLGRRESADARFRGEYVTQGDRAQRNNETWCSVSAWRTEDDGGHIYRTESLSSPLVLMQVRDYQ